MRGAAWCSIAIALFSLGCRSRDQDGSEARAQAEQIYRTRCVECHGPTGRGDGVKAPQLKKKPRDFADREWQRSEQDEELAEVIVHGGASEGYGDDMPANPDLAKRPELVAELVKIVRSFGQ
jgi:mono/diheme cytochrome c family protein